MKCRRVRHLLLDFVDGLGNEASHAEVDRHVAECAECEKFAAETSRCQALLRRAPLEPLDENFNWKVRLAVHREQRAGAGRAGSAGAWIRAWNLRYGVSTGIAFALVLVAGVVTMDRLGEPVGPSVRPAAPSDAARSSSSQNRGSGVEGREVQTADRPRVAAPRELRGLLVNTGDPTTIGDGSAVRGAIDRHAEEVAIDSLIDARLHRLSPEMRMRVIERQIHRLQSQLEVEREPGRQP